MERCLNKMMLHKFLRHSDPTQDCSIFKLPLPNTQTHTALVLLSSHGSFVLSNMLSAQWCTRSFRFLFILSLVQDHIVPLYFYLGKIRARRLHCQTTQVLVWCQACSDGSLALRQRQRPGYPHLWDFASLWGIAKSLLRGGFGHVSVSVCDHRNDGCSTVATQCSIHH